MPTPWPKPAPRNTNVSPSRFTSNSVDLSPPSSAADLEIARDVDRALLALDRQRADAARHAALLRRSAP